MKKIFLIITSIIAFIILISEPIKELTIKIVIIKVISLLYLWLLAKANNYFLSGGIKNEN